MQASDELARFGEVVAARRARLGLTRFAVRDAGGPSDTTLGYIENGTLGRAPSPATLAKLDRGLQWAKGSSAEVLAGGSPVALENRAISDRPLPDVYSPGPDSVLLPLDEINNLFRLRNDLHAVQRGRRVLDPTLTDFDRVVTDFNDFVSRVAGRYATAVLERNGGPDATVPLMVEMAFGPFLDVPAVGEEDHAEHEERLYRRWLAGRFDDLDGEMRERFAERWAERE